MTRDEAERLAERLSAKTGFSYLAQWRAGLRSWVVCHYGVRLADIEGAS